jgi:hypothetical protein
VFLEPDTCQNAGHTISLGRDAATGEVPPRFPRRRHPRPHAVRYPREDRTGPPTSAMEGAS